MALCAFHGRTEVRAAALARLAAQIEAGCLNSGPLVWNGRQGSVVGCLIESADAQQWVSLLGLPKWLAYALDTGLSNTSREKVLERTTALLNALRPGIDAGPAGSRLICALLDEAWAAIDGPQRRPELGDVLHAVKVMQARCHRGDAPEGSEWRGLRTRAMAITDSLQEPRQQAVAACAEAAGWDPQTSPTVVSDVLRLWTALQSLDANDAFGWTQADDEQIRQLLDALHAEHLAGKAGETRTVFDLLELHHAEIAARLRAHIRFCEDHQARCSERTADLLVRLLATQGA